MPDQTTPQNLLFLLSDEHNRKIAGCYGHPFVQTPNLDRLAAGGTKFTSAYCNSPICVPSRASLATGRHVHDIGYWDNAIPYAGTPRSWHEVLRDQGADVVSIGKLHFRGGDDYGFTEELIPLHVVDGKGDLKGLFRKELPAKVGTSDMATGAGKGSSTYSEYDTRIAGVACDWLRRRAAADAATPFVLFVSFVMPHFPLVAPEAYYNLYEKYGLEALSQGLDAPADNHPTLNRMRGYFDYDKYFNDERKAIALRAYFGMVTRLDALIGEVLEALETSGFGDNTAVLYTSDHGDNLGSRGLWGKSVMYEDSVGVPMILSGPGVPQGATVDTPVSLLDVAPTAVAATGVEASAEAYPGRSLFDLAQGADPGRAVLSQYHASGSDTGQFMLRKGRWKYIAYVGTVPQLFDLVADPDERRDLAKDPAHAAILAEMDGALRAVCDPEEVNRRAFADQQAVIDANGGRAQIDATVDIPFTPAPA
ncbi:sulfatase-like hydrolase/transferase [Fluviibacterium sp. DFM31]|uniref:Sulfatase-like hydrolase/transferase n=1 Tax=Meridianimarinicoccus marinus TaxID=3231483 RepID=A0ABV3LBG6_9RHOB